MVAPSQMMSSFTRVKREAVLVLKALLLATD
jgi:hypothetical protein